MRNATLTDDDIREYFKFEKDKDENLYGNTELLKTCFERTDPPRWRANDGIKYWFVNSIGKTLVAIEAQKTADNEFYEFGNYFQTKEEAEKYAKKWRELFTKK